MEKLALVALLAAAATPAAAQDMGGNSDTQTNRGGRAGRLHGSPCSGRRGADLVRCVQEEKAQQSGQSNTSGISAKDGKLFNDTATAATVQLQAKDFAGAAATYQRAIDANPKSAVLHRLYAGKAIALRQQAVAAYNSGSQPTYPPAGATNEQIRAANAANAALQTQKTAATVPILRQAQAAAGQAALLAAAPANKDHGADESIAIELRQDASLLYKLDHDAVLATPRASADLEAAALRKWLTANPTLADSLVGQFGIPTAATLVAKDPAAGLMLADEVIARASGDADAVIGYAELVAAKTSAGDPRRAKALAGLSKVEATVTDTTRSNKLKALKTRLAT